MASTRRARPAVAHNANGGLAYEIGVLEQRVVGVERGQAALVERIEEMGRGIEGRFERLTTAIERRTQPNLQAFSAIWGVVVVVGGIIYLLINSQIGANKEEIIQGRQERLAIADLLRKDYIPRIELTGWRVADQDRVDRIADALAELRKDSITQSDHDALIDRVARVEQSFGSTYSVGDVLRNIQERIQKLEERPIYAQAPAPALASPQAR